MKSARAFLPMSSASIRSLAMPSLAGTRKAKRYSSLSSKLELKGLVKPETASSTMSRANGLSTLPPLTLTSFKAMDVALKYARLLKIRNVALYQERTILIVSKFQ